MTNAVKAIIVNNGKILLLQRNPVLRYESNWDLPGGLIENGETESEALIREVIEEINASIEIITKSSTWTFKRRADNKIINVQNYICHLKNPLTKIVLSNEHISFKWINPKNIGSFQVKDHSLIQSVLIEFNLL